MFGDLKKYDYFCGNLVQKAGNLQQRLDSLRSKSQLLTERYVKLKTEKQAADATIAELTEELRRAKAENNVLSQQIEHLRVVTTIDPRREDVERSRAFLTELLQDIDKCINELTE